MPVDAGRGVAARRWTVLASMGRPHRGHGCGCPRPSPTSGPGFDALGLALGLLRRGRGRRSRRTASRSRSTARARRGALRRVAPGRARDARPRAPSLGDAPPGLRAALPQRDPARPRAGQSSAAAVVGRRGGRRRARRARRRPASGDAILQVAARHGGPCRQRGRQPARRVRRRVGDAGNNARAVRRCTARRRIRTSLRSRSSPEPSRSTSHDARAAARPGAARRRGLHRQPHRALGACAFTRAPSCCCPPPRTGCTRATARPAIPESAELVDALRGAGHRRPAISGAGPTVLALTADGRGARRSTRRVHRGAAAGRHRGGRRRGRVAACRRGRVVAATSGIRLRSTAQRRSTRHPRGHSSRARRSHLLGSRSGFDERPLPREVATIAVPPVGTTALPRPVRRTTSE